VEEEAEGDGGALPMTDDTHIPRGFRAAAVRAGLKASGSLDMAILAADSGCAAAGTFTTNRVAAAPVQWDRGLVPSDSIRGIVVNAGNANAATGAAGLDNVRRTAVAAAMGLGCRPEDVLVASTGVIGRPLPIELVEAGVRRALGELSGDVSAMTAASEAILTTDTRPKVWSRRCVVGGQLVTLTGIAKGAAMIGPRMATMLAFLLTDARVRPADLDRILRSAVDDSFNCISVEGHMSTNDTVLALASGAAHETHLQGDDLAAFAALVREACLALARMIPEDGEGATHLITIDVEGCRDRDQARSVARTVADDALIKTAIHGADPNWGRILSAAGRAGVAFDPGEVSLWLNGVLLYDAGTPAPFDAAAISAALRARREVNIRLRFGQGHATMRFWTCDLTAEYVRLNADYTT
jgi:glutamate N-acetyltransferase/amino-acid N-acetyltransferase